jgi:hypothetical protein
LWGGAFDTRTVAGCTPNQIILGENRIRMPLGNIDSESMQLEVPEKLCDYLGGGLILTYHLFANFSGNAS